MMATGRMIVSLVFVAAAAMPGAVRAHGEPGHAGPDVEAADTTRAVDAAVTGSFGEAVSSEGAVPLARVLAEPKRSPEPQLISGRIGKVCQNKGCWMTLHDGDAMVRVETGYRFAIPADATGDAVVLGTLKRSTLDEADAAHLRSESLDVAAGESWTLDAAGVRIVE